MVGYSRSIFETAVDHVFFRPCLTGRADFGHIADRANETIDHGSIEPIEQTPQPSWWAPP